MSGVLTRLVARARGEAASGLRPRLPARFEAPAAPLEHGDAEGAAARGPETGPTGRVGARLSGQQAEGPPDGPGHGPNPPSTPDTLHAGDEIHASGRAPRHVPESGRDRTASGPEDPVAEGRIPDRRSASIRADRETPLPPGARAASQGTRVAGAEKPGPTEQGGAESTARPAPDPGRRGERPEADRPPAPLMPVPPAPSFAPAGGAPGGLTVSVPGGVEPPAQPAAAPPEPDIVIHIGRIDLKAPAGPAPQPRLRPAQKPTTSLRDYLAGRRGGR